MCSPEVDIPSIIRMLGVSKLSERQLKIIERHKSIESLVCKTQYIVGVLSIVSVVLFTEQLGNRFFTIYLFTSLIYILYCIVFYLTSKDRLFSKLKKSLRKGEIISE